jgi:hypothetical protein
MKEPKGNNTTIHFLYLINLPIKKISDSKFIEGGQAILEAQSKKNIILNVGKKIIQPLFTKKLRLEDRS